MDKITKLSQAIRLGATFRPQCKRDPFAHRYDLEGTPLASCALGAAFEAVFGHTSADTTKAKYSLSERFGVGHDVMERVIRMNDLRGRTREEIADWLETIGY